MDFRFYFPKITDASEENPVTKEVRYVGRLRVDPSFFVRFYGLFDNGGSKRKIFIFGKTSADELVKSFTHESIHWLIDRLCGDKASGQYDNVWDKVEKKKSLLT